MTGQGSDDHPKLTGVSSDERLTGACQCGAVRYSVAPGRYRLHICHCLDCQRQSGSAFGMSLVVRPEAFELAQGELKTFKTVSDSGRDKTGAFCPECGVRIYNRTVALMSVKAGTLHDTTWLNPTACYWTKRKPSWVALPETLPCFE